MSKAGNGISGAAGEEGIELCQSCGLPLGARALFCHHCGAIQPPRDIDPFARLGLDRQFDIDLSRLDRQLAGFSRPLSPERFAERPRAQQAAARAQLAALKDAHRLLTNPQSRARLLLEQAGFDLSGPEDSDGEPDGEQDKESLLAALKAAFRVRALDDAAAILRRLDRSSPVEDGPT